jgi:addiction module HigA family antidote
MLHAHSIARIGFSSNMESLNGGLLEAPFQYGLAEAFVHPGEVLKEEFLVPLNVSAYRLSKEIHVPETRISEIINGKRAVTADTAIRLSKFFGTTAEFWLNLQNLYDLEEEEHNHLPEFEQIKKYASA